MSFFCREKNRREGKTTKTCFFVVTIEKPSYRSFKNFFCRRSHQTQNLSEPLPTPPTGTSQGLLRDHPLTRSSRTELPVSRFLRKLKRDASRIRVTRPSPSLLARNLKSMSSRIRCDIRADTRQKSRCKRVTTGSNPSDQSYLLIFLSFKNSERSADHSRPKIYWSPPSILSGDRSGANLEPLWSEPGWSPGRRPGSFPPPDRAPVIASRALPCPPPGPKPAAADPRTDPPSRSDLREQPSAR